MLPTYKNKLKIKNNKLNSLFINYLIKNENIMENETGLSFPICYKMSIWEAIYVTDTNLKDIIIL